MNNWFSGNISDGNNTLYLPLSRFSQEKRIYWFFIIQTVGVTFAQKFALPVGDDLGVSLALPLMIMGVLFLVLNGDAKISTSRAVLFFSLVVTSLISHLFITSPFSVAGLFLFLITTSFWAIEITVKYSFYRRLLNVFQIIMLISASINIIQNIWQYLFGWPDFFNIELFVPSWILFPGYVYIQPLFYGSPIMKPPGVFLEVSFLSQALAVAIVVEITVFKNVSRLCLLSLGVLGTYAGTGPLTLIIVLPFLLRNFSKRLAITSVIVVAAVMTLSIASGSLDAVLMRASEFSTPNTSASHRFIRPLEVIPSYFENDFWPIAGIGAGNIEKAPNVVWWAMNKVFREYGLLSFFIYYCFLFVSLFRGNPNFLLALTLFVTFNFMGGYASNPPMALLLMLLGTSLRISNEPEK